MALASDPSTPLASLLQPRAWHAPCYQTNSQTPRQQLLLRYLPSDDDDLGPLGGLGHGQGRPGALSGKLDPRSRHLEGAGQVHLYSTAGRASIHHQHGTTPAVKMGRSANEGGNAHTHNFRRCLCRSTRARKHEKDSTFSNQARMLSQFLQTPAEC